MTRFGVALLLTSLVARAETPIVIETTLGNIEAVLHEDKAPITVANFLRYLVDGRYNGGQFHRTVRSKFDNQPMNPIKIDVIQASVRTGTGRSPYPAIPLERTSVTGLRHTDGALSMARGELADSATSDFFICIGPQPELDHGGKRNPDLQGFAVFGHVTKGMDVVRKIQDSPSGPTGPGANAASAGNQRLTPPIPILAVRRR
jgi:peptidyl-prolyl cis-trans isomerase A (cyclophilin A)